MNSIQPTLLALALASLLFDVGLGREQLGAVQSDPTRQYEVSGAASCIAIGCEPLTTVKACNEASQVLYKKKMEDKNTCPPRTNWCPGSTSVPWNDMPSHCFQKMGTSIGAYFNSHPPVAPTPGDDSTRFHSNGAPNKDLQVICSCPANKCATPAPTSAPTETCEAMQGAVNDKCGTGGDTPVNKLITDVTSQIDNNPEDPMVDLTGIYKLKEVEGWQKEGGCSAFKKDPAYLATELVKKLKDDLAKIGANVM